MVYEYKKYFEIPMGIDLKQQASNNNETNKIKLVCAWIST